MTDALPDPLVPADCDLRGFAYMGLDVVRLRDSGLVIEATAEEFRAAVLLWCASWHQIPAASLPNNERALGLLAGCGRDQRGWKRLRDGAMRGWVLCSDNRWYHPVVAAKALEAKGQKEVAKRRRDRDAERLRKWRLAHGETVDETHNETDRETCFSGERSDRIRSDRISRDLERGDRGSAPHEGATADGPPPPSRDPDPAAPAALKVVSSVDPETVRGALAQGDLLALVTAFGCNRDGARASEWARDADGLTLHTVAVILGWKRSQRAPIREPSGFRAARKAWRDDLDDDYRTDVALEVLGGLGVEMPTVRPSTRAKS